VRFLYPCIETTYVSTYSTCIWDFLVSLYVLFSGFTVLSLSFVVAFRHLLCSDTPRCLLLLLLLLLFLDALYVLDVWRVWARAGRASAGSRGMTD